MKRCQNSKLAWALALAVVPGVLSAGPIKFDFKAPKKMNVPVRLTCLKGQLAKRNRVPEDLLLLRADFKIKRSDYEINLANKGEKVSDEIELKLRVAGVAPH